MKRRSFLGYGLGLSVLPCIQGCQSLSAVLKSRGPASVRNIDSKELVQNLRYAQIPISASSLYASNDFETDSDIIQHSVEEALNSGRFKKIRVSAGGHSYIGASVARDAFVLDLSPFKKVVLNSQNTLVRVSAGCRFFQIYNRLASVDPDLFIASGDCPTVGVAGYTIGGGVSMLSPLLGLGVDRIVEANILVFKKDSSGQYKAEKLTLTPISNPDLYWATLGGGGQFGIVTDFTLRVDRLQNFYLYEISKKTTTAGFVSFFQAWEKLGRESLSPQTSSKLQADSYAGLSVSGIFSGNSGDETKLKNFAANQGAAIIVKPLTSESMHQAFSGCKSLSECETTSWTSDPVYFSAKSTLIKQPGQLSTQALTKIAEALTRNPVADYAYIQFNRWCGKMKTSNPSVSFPFRDFTYACQVYSKTSAAERWQQSKYFDTWVDEVTSYLGERKAAFLNHVHADVVNNKSLYLGSSEGRLNALKAIYDPQKIFSAFEPAV